MNRFDDQADALRRRYAQGDDGISRLILHFVDQVEVICSDGDHLDQYNRRRHELLMQIKVLELAYLNLHSHAEMPSVSLDHYSDLAGMQVLRGVFSPEFATDSYQWANYIARRGLVDGKSVLEMGAGSGVISLFLHRNATPRSICAVDVNRYAVVNLHTNVDQFGIDPSRFEVIESDLFSLVPSKRRFDVVLWAMPWIFSDERFVRQVLEDCDDPCEKVLLRSIIDPSGESVRKFISDARSRLSPHGKVLLISSDFIPNGMIRRHAEEEGYLYRETVFAKNATVVEATGMALDLYHLELTLQ
ncbi:MAG: methyltransferase [Prosthecobacter sp.]|uniref:methyltransferase n=1 Tax=Prosthecobacter sp. TaxID=1965333 RepID=UPI001A034A4F|nr:methyltransferase [Prosthecobacter sp.]MBE2281843.1 methyltransferase [Prosthecobacter sp.]